MEERRVEEREREREKRERSRFIPHIFLQKYSLAPNIMAMVSSFNQLALLIPSEILEEQTPQARAKVISNFIKVGEQVSPSGHPTLYVSCLACYLSMLYSLSYIKELLTLTGL